MRWGARDMGGGGGWVVVPSAVIICQVRVCRVICMLSLVPSLAQANPQTTARRSNNIYLTKHETACCSCAFRPPMIPSLSVVFQLTVERPLSCYYLPRLPILPSGTQPSPRLRKSAASNCCRTRQLRCVAASGPSPMTPGRPQLPAAHIDNGPVLDFEEVTPRSQGDRAAGERR